VRERDHLEDLGEDGRIILKSILNGIGGGLRIGLIFLRIGSGSCVCGNQSSGSVKFRKFLDLQRTYWLLRKGSVSWS